jgi:hypothetical protein
VAGKGDIEGLDQVLAYLSKEIKAIPNRTLKGLIRAGIVIMRDMEQTPPVIPVDTGNLRASRFMVTSAGETKRGQTASFKGEDADRLTSEHSAIVNRRYFAREPTVWLGFSAFYAWFVHENVGANFARPKIVGKGKKRRETSRRAGAGAKFLEAALFRNSRKVLSIIAEEAKKGGRR